MPAAWERAFREAYADELEARGAARPAARSGGKSTSRGTTDLIECSVYLTGEEREATRALAKAANVSWSTWARRKLTT